MRHLLDDHVQHFVGDILDLIALLLLLQPFQHLLLVFQISLVQLRYSLLEIQHAGNFFDAILLRFLRVVDLHEDHAKLIALVIDVLQFVENLLRFPIVVVI